MDQKNTDLKCNHLRVNHFHGPDGIHLKKWIESGARLGAVFIDLLLCFLQNLRILSLGLILGICCLFVLGGCSSDGRLGFMASTGNKDIQDAPPDSAEAPPDNPPPLPDRLPDRPQPEANRFAGPDNYLSVVRDLSAGDVLLLEPGHYGSSLYFNNHHGTAENPIVVMGPSQGNPAVFTGRTCCNTVQFSDSSHIEVRDLTLDGLGLSEPAGVESRGASNHHITLYNLLIKNYNGSQGTVSISTKSPAWNWVVQKNTIKDSGTGLYLGNSNGELPFVAGIIEGNTIVNSIGYNMQIKHQNPRPINIGMPETPQRTIIRYNLFSKTAAASSTEGGARPNLLLGHFPLSGVGANDVYEVYGNLFYDNPTESLFQGEGNLALYSNVFVQRSSRRAIAIQAHNDQPRDVFVFRNTVLSNGTGISLSGVDTNYTQRIFANVVFASSPLQVGEDHRENNFTGAYTDATQFLANPMANLEDVDVTPLDASMQGKNISPALIDSFTGYDLDYNRNLFAPADRGALRTPE